MTLREKRVGSSGNWELEWGEEREEVTCVISHCLLLVSSSTKTEFWKSTSLIWIHNSVCLRRGEGIKFGMTFQQQPESWTFSFFFWRKHLHPKITDITTETLGSSAVAQASTYLFHVWLSIRPAGWEWNSERHPEYNACFRWSHRQW